MRKFEQGFSPQELEANEMKNPEVDLSKERRGWAVETHSFGQGIVREYVRLRPIKGASFTMRGMVEQAKEELQEEGIELSKESSKIYPVSDITYEIPGRRTFKLSELLPKDVKLYRTFVPEVFSAFRKNILYSERIFSSEKMRSAYMESEKHRPFFEDPGAFLILLHELGHSHNQESWSELFARFRFTLKVEKDKPLNAKEGKLYFSKIIQQERDAWAYALKTLRKLKEEGIDLAPNMPELKDILPLVHSCIASHELKMLAVNDPETASEWEDMLDYLIMRGRKPLIAAQSKKMREVRRGKV